MSSFTSFNSSLVTNTITTSNVTVNDYDYDGAAVYIVVILIWYSAGLVLTLFFRVRPRTFESQVLFDYQTSGKSTASATNPFARYYDMQADNVKKEILNELKNPENRQRLWKIYYSSAEKQNEPHAQYYQTITADTVTIGHINRKLADIRRMGARKDDDRDDDLIPSSLTYSSSDNRFEAAKFFSKRFASRRTSVGSLYTRRPLLRVPSLTEPLSSMSPVQAAPPIDVKLSTNNSRKVTNGVSKRFTVEKVPEINRKCSTVQENVSH